MTTNVKNVMNFITHKIATADPSTCVIYGVGLRPLDC
jgi:hypothetical protein